MPSWAGGSPSGDRLTLAGDGILEAWSALGVHVTDEETPPPTVRARALSVGIPDERLVAYVERGLLLLDGEPVTDLDAPTPPGSRIVIAGS